MVEEQLVLLLHQLCCIVSSDPSILELFFHSSEDQGAANFLLFSLLVPFIHRDGVIGQQARDALLLIMTLSNDNERVAKHIAHNTFFCPVSFSLFHNTWISPVSLILPRLFLLSVSSPLTTFFSPLFFLFSFIRCVFILFFLSLCVRRCWPQV